MGVAPPPVQDEPSYSKVVFKNAGPAGPVAPPKTSPAVCVPAPDVFHLTPGKAVPLDHAADVITLAETLNSSLVC